MASYNGYDAFWAERIKKEVITQMRHQEDYEIVTKKKLGKFYQQIAELPGSALSSGRKNVLGDFHSFPSRSPITSLIQRRSSTPIQVGSSQFQAQQSKEQYLNQLKKNRSKKKLSRVSSAVSLDSFGRNASVGGINDHPIVAQFGREKGDELQNFLENQTVPYMKKVVGGEKAYKKAVQRVNKHGGKRPQTQIETSKTDQRAENFRTIGFDQNQGSRNNLFEAHFAPQNSERKTTFKVMNKGMKVFKEHLPKESQSIASTKARELSQERYTKLAKVELAQLVAHRLKNARRGEDTKSTISVFYNNQTRLSQESNSIFNGNRLADEKSRASNQISQQQLSVKSNFLRALEEMKRQGSFSYISKLQKAREKTAPQSTISNSKGMIKFTKGQKAERFNEQVFEPTQTQSIALQDYVDQEQTQDGREIGNKIKINLRQIHNPVQREQFRKLLSNKSNSQIRPKSSISAVKINVDQISQVFRQSNPKGSSIPTSKLSKRVLKKLDRDNAQQRPFSRSYINMDQSIVDSERKRPATACLDRVGSASKLRLRTKKEIMKHIDSMDDEELQKIRQALPSTIVADEMSQEVQPAEENEYGLINEQPSHEGTQSLDLEASVIKEYFKQQGIQNDEDKTTQYSIQASALTRNHIFHENGKQNLQKGYTNKPIDDIESVSASLGKSTSSVQRKQFKSLERQLSSERAKRKQMENTLAELVRISHRVEEALVTKRTSEKPKLTSLLTVNEASYRKTKPL